MTTNTIPPTLVAALRKGGRKWISRLYRHEILQARTVRGLQIEAMQAWNRIVVKPVLDAVASTISRFDLRGNDVVLDAFPQLRSLEESIRATAGRGTAELRRITTQGIADIVTHEVDWLAKNAEKSLGINPPKPTTQQVMVAVEQRPFLGEKVETWFKKTLQQPTGDNARRVIQTGLQRGFTTDEIVRMLRGKRETGYSDGVLSGQSVRDVQMLVQSTATHASAVTRIESFKALGVTKQRFLATLDEKTCPICGAQDGKVEELGKGPQPPLHPRCRCVLVPDFGGDPIGERASVDGPVPADTDFEGWLEGQGVGVQNEVLGRTKAEAWRSGKLPLRKMLGSDLQPLTLDELRQLDRIPDEE